MFYSLAILSMLGYALQGTLLVRYARNMDGLSLTFYRNCSFLITLLPLLAFSSPEEVMVVLSHWKILVVAGVSGGMGLALVFAAYRFISVSVVHTVGSGFGTVLMTAFGVFLYGEMLSPPAFLLIAAIAGACIWLAFQKIPTPHISQRMMLGILLALVSDIPFSITKIAMTDLSRFADPLASGYFWEASIGIATLAIILLRSLVWKKGLQKIARKDVLMIALCSSPTLIGTGGYALALRLGPVAIVNAVSTGSLFVTALLAWKWYRERPSPWQWLALTIIMAAIAGLKFT